MDRHRLESWIEALEEMLKNLCKNRWRTRAWIEFKKSLGAEIEELKAKLQDAKEKK